MLNHNPIIALELARAHARELEREADHRRLLASMPRVAGPSPMARARALVARPVRAVSHASQAISDTACTVATRLEGRSA